MLSYLPKDYQWPTELSYWNVVEKQKVRDKSYGNGLEQKYAFGVVDDFSYCEEEQKRFERLFNRQLSFWNKWASEKHLSGVYLFKEDFGVPEFKKINENLYKKTGFVIVGVNGLLSAENFFELLANRIFPVTWWLRNEEEMDYIVEPDLFHDLVGHVPMLMLDEVADFMVNFGKAGLKRKNNKEELKKLSSLYWFTAEFGLIKENNQLKIWGAGILSSSGEMAWSMSNSSQKEEVYGFDKLMNSSYKIDEMQPFYFVIPGWEKLKEIEKLF